MPTYDYRCDGAKGGCGHQEERFLPISKAPTVTICPRCQTRALTKLITAGVHTSGGHAPGNRVQYPVYNFGLPIAAGEKPGGPSQIVHSKRDLIEKSKRAGLLVDQI